MDYIFVRLNKLYLPKLIECRCEEAWEWKHFASWGTYFFVPLYSNFKRERKLEGETFRQLPVKRHCLHIFRFFRNLFSSSSSSSGVNMEASACLGRRKSLRYPEQKDIYYIAKTTFDYYHHPIRNVNIFAYVSFFFTQISKDIEKMFAFLSLSWGGKARKSFNWKSRIPNNDVV